MEIRIVLNPDSAESLAAMLAVLENHKVTPGATLAPALACPPPAPMPKEERNGPCVTEYLQASGQERFKRTAAEIARFGDDREAAARERLLGVTIPVPAPGPAVTVADHSTLDEDDL